MQPLQPEDPDRVGAYRVLARLGEGGMGTVYLGSSPGGRMVAVKLVRAWLARDARYRARFRREVAAARTVTGAFTAPLLDADPDAEVPWLAAEYLPGLSLRAASGAFGAFPADTVRLLGAALAEALADIHRAGLAHRDLKPENIILTAGGPRVIDFGIARPDAATAITLPGALLGTPGFMSPEQASGGLAGPESDVFALGAVLLYAATGREPFRAADRATTLERVRLARVDLTGLGDRRLRSLIASCLRRDPAHRPSAATLLARLDEPTASVHGTRWLPAQLAEEIDRRLARPEPPPGTVLPPTAFPLPAPGGGAAGAPGPVGAAAQPPGRHDETTADPEAAPDVPESAERAVEPAARAAYPTVTADGSEVPGSGPDGVGVDGPARADSPRTGEPRTVGPRTGEPRRSEALSGSAGALAGSSGAFTGQSVAGPDAGYVPTVADGPAPPGPSAPDVPSPLPGQTTADRPAAPGAPGVAGAAVPPMPWVPPSVGEGVGKAKPKSQSLSQSQAKAKGEGEANGRGGRNGGLSGGLPGTPRPRTTSRRSLLAAAAALPVAAGAALLIGRALTAPDQDPPSSHRTPAPSAKPPSRAPATPPVADGQWRTRVLGGKSTYPDLYTAGGAVFVTDTGGSDVHALDARTGRALWSLPSQMGPAEKVTTGPDAVYLVAGKSPDASSLRAVDPVSGRTRWAHPAPPYDFVWGVATTGSLVCVNFSGRIQALDAKSGRARWSAPSPGQTVSAGDGLVVVVGDGELVALDASNGRTRWRYKVPDVSGSPMIEGGLVLVRNTFGTLYAIAAKDGKGAWKKELDYRGTIRQAGGGLVFVDDDDGTVRALRAGTGEAVWSRALGKGEQNPYGESSALGLSGGTLWVGTTDRTVYALDAADGHTLWTYGADATYTSSSAHGAGAVAASGLVVLSTQDGHVEAVRAPAGGADGGGPGTGAPGGSDAGSGGRIRALGTGPVPWREPDRSTRTGGGRPGAPGTRTPGARASGARTPGVWRTSGALAPKAPERAGGASYGAA